MASARIFILESCSSLPEQNDLAAGNANAQSDQDNRADTAVLVRSNGGAPAVAAVASRRKEFQCPDDLACTARKGQTPQSVRRG